ncbi:hypothetical protein ACSZN8_06805 [Aeromonas caviae]|uniref:hypothetical protein n=1 Tax=Aeromonas caviae TaxID=648 RepID=UPI003EC84668
MATLSDLIQATAGLLAYWPLNSNGNDLSGNNRHLTPVGSVSFLAPPMTTQLVPSVLTPPFSGSLRIAQDSLPKIKAVEGIFRLDGEKGNGTYSTAIGVNQPLTGNAGRYMLLYQDNLGVCSYQNMTNPSVPVSYPSLTNFWENLSVGNHHYVVQLNEAGTATEVYIDGVKDSAMTVPFDVFSQAAGKYLTVGAYYYNAVNNGSCQTCDVAIYGRPLTQEEITARQPFRLGDPVIKTAALNAVPANQEPRSQFEPQDVEWRGSPGAVYAGPMSAVPVTAAPLCQGRDQNWIRDGEQGAEQGYIESTVTINGEGVRRRVLCFEQAGNLIGETYSRASDGKYRFDLLWLNRRYMLVAQDDPAFGPADYNAVAADFQLPTPYAPGEGVGLSGG